MADSGRRIAVTGAAGYIGGRLLRRLEEEAGVEHILALDIRPLASRHSGKIAFRAHDIASPVGCLLARNRIDTVVHLAFVVQPGRDRRAIHRTNVGGMASVLAGCAEAAVGHLLYLSSTTVYGAHEDNPAMLTEESPMRPVRGFQYGEDKAESERLLARHLAGNLGLNATVLRACPVLGPTSDNFIARAFSKPVLVGLWRHDPPVQLVHEDDLVDAMGRCILDRVEGVYNVAGDGSILWSEMGRILGRKRLTLPASLLYPLTQAAWALHLQSDSPASGLDFIRHRWTADTSRLKAALGTASWHSSEEVWRSFARHRAGVRESEQPPRARHRSDPRCP